MFWGKVLSWALLAHLWGGPAPVGDSGRGRASRPTHSIPLTTSLLLVAPGWPRWVLTMRQASRILGLSSNLGRARGHLRCGAALPHQNHTGKGHLESPSGGFAPFPDACNARLHPGSFSLCNPPLNQALYGRAQARFTHF